jgi:hypothetical protein
MIAIAGRRCKGLGDAAANLVVQLPFIEREFPELTHCHRGTINLELEYPLLVLTPDHRTRPIPWKQGPEFGEGEVFDLLRIELEAPTGTLPVQAWLYLSQISPHRANPHLHEVLAPKLPVDDVQHFTIRIHRPTVQLAYRTFPAILVF